MGSRYDEEAEPPRHVVPKKLRIYKLILCYASPQILYFLFQLFFPHGGYLSHWLPSFFFSLDHFMKLFSGRFLPIFFMALKLPPYMTFLLF